MGDGRPDSGPHEAAGAPEQTRALQLASGLAVASLFLAAGAFCLTRATDTDLWWHLASGDLIRRTGVIPRADPFSFTVIGNRWIDIHWLFQVVLSLLHERGGLRLLDLFRIALILGSLGIVYTRCRRVAAPATAVAVLLLTILACQERFLTRPEIVSWLLMVTVLLALQKALDAGTRSGRRRILFVVLPLLHLVWVNVQGLFILGPVFLTLALLAAACGYLRARVKAPDGGVSPAGGAERDPDRVIDFLAALALCALVCLVNPYGAAALRLPFDLLFSHLGGETLLSRTIAEFRPPLSGYLVTPAIVAFGVLAIVTLVSILMDLPRARPFDLLVIGATLAVALKARRNIPIFALAAAPILALHLSALLRHGVAASARLAARLRAAQVVASIVLAGACLGLTADVATNRFYLRRPTERWFGSGEIPGYFPEDAAGFVAGAGIPGQVFHSLAVGGYLIHAWGGERGVFIDGRNDPYLDGVLAEYLKAIADPAAFEETVRRYQIAAVLWPHHRALEARPLLSYLAGGHGWALVHLDEAAAVYLRADLISAARLGERPFPPGVDRREVYQALYRRLEARPFSGPPIREIALGEFFSVSGDAAGAEYFYGRALERLPSSAPILHGHALALERLGRTAEARAEYERAVSADRDFLPAASALGAMFLDEGRQDEAERLIEAAYRGGERGSRLLLARARLFDRKGDVPHALGAYRDALLRSPRDTAILRALAQFYVSHGEASTALPFYTAAAEADPGDPAIAREMAELLERLGRVTAALDVVRDAARRAVDRLDGDRTGSWTLASPGRDEDRRLLLLAADLERRAGDGARASDYLAALSRAGLLAGDKPEGAGAEEERRR